MTEKSVEKTPEEPVSEEKAVLEKKAVPEKRAAPEKRSVPNVIYIGKKPLMNYVIGAILQFNQGAKSVTVKARGKAISRAVDVVEITKRRFLAGETNVSDIKIGTETVGEGDEIRNVSTIEIQVTRKT